MLESERMKMKIITDPKVLRVTRSLRFAVTHAASWMWRVGAHHAHRRGQGKPGEIIERMSQEDRDSLKELTSDVAKDMAVEECDLYSPEYEANKQVSEMKTKFDKQLKDT